MLLVVCALLCVRASLADRPHNSLSNADDLIPMPKSDAPAFSGLLLRNYYTPKLCIPTRAALMTGKYPLKNGTNYNGAWVYWKIKEEGNFNADLLYKSFAGQSIDRLGLMPSKAKILQLREPDVLRDLLSELERINATTVPPNNTPLDPLEDPNLWQRVYTNFGDYDRIHGYSLS